MIQNSNNDEISEKRLKELAREALGKKRFKHVKNVVDMAEKLALRYGEDPEKARKAAWLHDIAKDFTSREMLDILSLDENLKKEVEKRPFSVWHGPVGAFYAKEKLGVRDEEILMAVSNHTTGRPSMTGLEKIVLLADMISKERRYSGVDVIRQAAKESLDKGVYLSLTRSAAFVAESGIEMDEQTQLALDWYDKNGAYGGNAKSSRPI